MEDAESNNRKERLLGPVSAAGRDEEKDLCVKKVIEEVKRVGWLGAPMVAVVLSQYMLQIISMMVVGHLGQLALSSSSLATSFCNVTGFSFILGMSSALDTLSGQAFGAKLYRKLGLQTCTAIFCLALVCIPVSLLWLNIGKLLVWIGQDPLISHEAARYAMWLIPGLFSYAALQPLGRYFQTQSLMGPLLITSCLVLCLHVPLCWLLVHISGLLNVGGALAFSLSNWVTVVLLGLFMRYSSDCSQTRPQLSMEIFHGVGEFFRFAIPSAAMICLEWWSFEFLILLSGLLPNPQLETSVLSICLQTTATIYSVPSGIGAAASVRVSNELGAGNSRAARIVVFAALSLAIAEAVIACSSLLASRHVFGHIFSNDKEVVHYFAAMAPLVSVSLIMDSFHGVLSGIARGSGWQRIGAYINLGAFYLWGIPIAAILAIQVHLKGVGLWVGIQAGCFLQISLLSIVTCCTNWEKQASEARKRMFDAKEDSVRRQLLN